MLRHEHDHPDLDDATLAAIRTAARGLIGQTGRGLPRTLMLALAGSTARPMTIVDGEPAVAVVHEPRRGQSAAFARLTPRERDVAELLADGLTNQQIADRLVISVATVKDHVHRILHKTGLPSRSAVGAAWRS